jgi:hypothetical protein
VTGLCASAAAADVDVVIPKIHNAQQTDGDDDGTLVIVIIIVLISYMPWG